MIGYCSIKWLYEKNWAGAIRAGDVKAAGEYKRLMDEHIEVCHQCREAKKAEEK